jgi:hypothetical protein
MPNRTLPILGTEDLEAAMKRIVISSVAVVAMLAAAATLLQSHPSPTDKPNTSTNKISLEEMSAKVDANKLPNLEIEDQSVVFSTQAKR